MKFLFTSHHHWRHDGRLISMEVRSCCLKVGWDDAIATTKPNHNFIITKLQKKMSSLSSSSSSMQQETRGTIFFQRRRRGWRREEGRKKLEKIKTRQVGKRGVGGETKIIIEKIKKGKKNESRKKFEFYFFNLPKCQWALS